jgi:hypothetical protein
MVVIERRFSWLLCYKMVFFANETSLRRIAEELRPTEIARLFHTTGRLDESRFVIRREKTFTVYNDLRQPLEELWKGFAPYNRAEV